MGPFQLQQASRSWFWTCSCTFLLTFISWFFSCVFFNYQCWVDLPLSFWCCFDLVADVDEYFRTSIQLQGLAFVAFLQSYVALLAIPSLVSWNVHDLEYLRHFYSWGHLEAMVPCCQNKSLVNSCNNWLWFFSDSDSSSAHSAEITRWGQGGKKVTGFGALGSADWHGWSGWSGWRVPSPKYILS